MQQSSMDSTVFDLLTDTDFLHSPFLFAGGYNLLVDGLQLDEYQMLMLKIQERLGDLVNEIDDEL